jgi:4-hydroxybenzoate polyprenyltransferase
VASRLRALRVVHPFPSLLNTALIVAIAGVAGADLPAAAALGLGMLGIQMCIGATNDLCDVELDAATKPWKPIPAGLITAGSTQLIGAVCAALAIAAPLTLSLPVASMAAAMLTAGLVYDFWLKRTVWAWVCFAVAFAILPVYAWYGAAGSLPPLAHFLIPLAALAGPALHLSNGLVDLERDRAAGLTTLASRLGRTRTLVAIAVLLVVVHVLAWATLSVGASQLNLAVVGASALAIVGLAFQSRLSVRQREIGWSLQAAAIALLGVGWVSAVA